MLEAEVEAEVGGLRRPLRALAAAASCNKFNNICLSKQAQEKVRLVEVHASRWFWTDMERGEEHDSMVIMGDSY